MTDRRKGHRDEHKKRRAAPRPHSVLKAIEDATYSILRDKPEQPETEPKPHDEHKHKPHKH